MLFVKSIDLLSSASDFRSRELISLSFYLGLDASTRREITGKTMIPTRHNKTGDGAGWEWGALKTGFSQFSL